MITTHTLMGDSRETLKSLPDASVHCAITSPPYWGLRSYLPKGHSLKHLEIGMERTPEEYVEKLVAVFGQVRRVLREDGSLWVNLGDSYTASNRGSGGHSAKQDSNRGSWSPDNARGFTCDGCKPKDLVMIPALVAMALRADGWYLRSQIPWIKRNAMPESCTDRPAVAVEYVFLLSKSKSYYYDRYAVMMESSDNTHPRTGRDGSFKGNAAVDLMRLEKRGLNPKTDDAPNGSRQNPSFAAGCSQYVVGQRNRRNSDWLLESWQGLLTDDAGDPLAFIVNPKGTKIAHYASYPEKLVEPMIKAGTSERGCCPKCGAGWERIVVEQFPESKGSLSKGEKDPNGVGSIRSTEGVIHWGKNHPSISPKWFSTGKTLDWKPACQCFAIEDTPDPIPCTVLDPFAGTHTTSAVANRLGRQAIDCELNPDYHAAAEHRTAQGGLL